MEKPGSKKDEFRIRYSPEPVPARAADGGDLRPVFEPDGPSAGFRSPYLGGPGDIDDGGAVNAPDPVRVQFIGDNDVVFPVQDFGGAAGGMAVLAPVRRTCWKHLKPNKLQLVVIISAPMRVVL